MDRFEKIATALIMAGLIGVLLCSHRRGTLADVRLNTPALPDATGPSYLVAALPLHRHRDDYAPPVSERILANAI